MGKQFKGPGNKLKEQLNIDDFEDFGYNVKNIRRQSKKKVARYKEPYNEWEDS